MRRSVSGKNGHATACWGLVSFLRLSRVSKQRIFCDPARVQVIVWVARELSPPTDKHRAGVRDPDWSGLVWYHAVVVTVIRLLTGYCQTEQASAWLTNVITRRLHGSDRTPIAQTRQFDDESDTDAAVLSAAASKRG